MCPAGSPQGLPGTSARLLVCGAQPCNLQDYPCTGQPGTFVSATSEASSALSSHTAGSCPAGRDRALICVKSHCGLQSFQRRAGGAAHSAHKRWPDLTLSAAGLALDSGLRTAIYILINIGLLGSWLIALAGVSALQEKWCVGALPGLSSACRPDTG